MAKKLLFSILTPTRNRGKEFLPQTIRSVQGQVLDGFDYEHIIIDDGSTDDTKKIVAEFRRKDKRIKYIRNNKSLGPAAALNRGLNIAQGQLITTLDDDDLLPPSSLKLRVEFMKKNPDVDWSSGFLLNIDENNQLYSPLPEQLTPAYISHGNMFAQILKTNYIKNNTLAIRSKALKKIRGWDENVHAGQDWALYMDLLFHNFRYALNPSYLALYRIHSSQRSGQFARDKSWDATREYFIKKYRL